MDESTTTLIIVGMVGGFALLSQVMRQFFKRREGRMGSSRGDARFDEIGLRLETLQNSIDATAIEVERLGEGLRFTTKLLAERNGAWDPPRSPERVITPH
jgi:hypothetical protein